MDGEFPVYSLEGLAHLEGTDDNYLRTVIKRRRKSGKPLQWRTYQFVKVGREWAAIDIGSPITVYNAPGELADPPGSD